MNIWVIKDGEVLPLESGASTMRTGMLADELVGRGHTVTWWASTFCHQTKRRLFHRDTTVEVRPRFGLRLLDGGEYHRNISLRRVVHHRLVGRRFAQIARTMPRPDVIVAALPTIDLAYEAARYSRRAGVPLIMDVRDPWPESLVDKCAPAVQGLTRLLLAPEYRRAATALNAATAVAAISPGCLQWGLQVAGRARSEHDSVFFIGRQTHMPGREPGPRMTELLARIAGKVVFVYVGTFGHSYQLGLIAEAAAALSQQGHSGAHFVLAGEGHQRPALERRAEGLGNLTVTGWLNRDELAALLAASSVGLVPLLSVPQAFSNKIFEYMSAGLPMLTSLRGETGDLIARHQLGRLYTAGDVRSFCDSVLLMMNDREERVRMGERSRRLFDTTFRADRIYAQYADLVEKVAS